MTCELAEFIKSRKKITLLMVIANILIFAAIYITGGDTLDVSYMRAHGAMYPGDILTKGKYLQLVTSMFLHFGIEHLLYNMLLLIFAGNMLEERIGSLRFVLIYLGGGICGNLLSLAVSLATGNYAVSAGASGAIFAVIGGLVWLVLGEKERGAGIDKRGLLAMILLNFLQGFWTTGIDNMAHLGGFMGGFLLAMITSRLTVTRNEIKI